MERDFCLWSQNKIINTLSFAVDIDQIEENRELLQKCAQIWQEERRKDISATR